MLSILAVRMQVWNGLPVPDIPDLAVRDGPGPAQPGPRPPSSRARVLVAFAGVAGVAGALARRTDVFPPPWQRLPLVLGVATPVLLMVVGGMLSEIDERLLEVPLVLVAIAWVKLGLLIASPTNESISGDVTRRPDPSRASDREEPREVAVEVEAAAGAGTRVRRARLEYSATSFSSTGRLFGGASAVQEQLEGSDGSSGSPFWLDL